MRIELSGFPLQLMQTNNDCGPTAVYQVARYYNEVPPDFDYASLLKLWGWNDSNFSDTPYNHIRIWKKLGYSLYWFRADDGKIRDFLSSRNPVVILSRKDPLVYHWQVITGSDWEDQWIVSTGYGSSPITPKVMKEELFDTYLDTRMLGIGSLAYIALKDRKHRGLSIWWSVFQHLLGWGSKVIGIFA